MKRFNQVIVSKEDELKKKIADLKVNDTISKNTRSTQLVKVRRDLHSLQLINELLNYVPEDANLSKEAQQTLATLTTLASERIIYEPIVVKEGDSILELLSKYDNRRDIKTKLCEAADKIGCHLDFGTGKIARNK